MRVVLASRGAYSGRRVCLLCGQLGHTTRVHIPASALRVDQPDYRGLRVYWVCVEHAEVPNDDPTIAEALQRKGGKR